MQKSFLKKYACKAALLVAAGALVSSCAAFTPSETAGPWGSFMKDDGRSNASADAVGMPMKMVWDRDISGFTMFKGYKKYQLASPSLVDSTIFIGSSDHTFYSMDMKTGRVLWKFDAGYPLEGPATVSDDKVCFGSADGFMRCLDRDGKPLWEFRARSEIISSPIVRDEKVYFSSSDDRLYALDAKTGEKVWNYNRRVFTTVTPRIYASPAWADGRIYHFFSDGTLVCLSAADGREIWTRKLVSDFDGSEATRRTPLVKGGVVYAIDNNNAIVALDAETGNVKGLYNIIKARDFVMPGKDTLVIAGTDRVISTRISTGEILWDTAIVNSPMESIFAAGDYLFVLSNHETRWMGIYFFTTSRGYVEALKLDDGTVAWTSRLDSSISANGAAAEGSVVLLPDSGELALYTSP